MTETEPKVKQPTEIERATKDLMIRVRKILENQQRLGTDFNKHPTLALVIVRKNLDKRIQNHPIMKSINIRQLVIYVLVQMGIDVDGKNKVVPIQEPV